MNERCAALGLILLERGVDYAVEDAFAFRIALVKSALAYEASDKPGKSLDALGFISEAAVEDWLGKFEADCAARMEKERMKAINSLMGATRKELTARGTEADNRALRELIEKRYPACRTS